MNRRNVTLRRRCAQAVSALVILLSAISVGAPSHADEAAEFSREVIVGDATIGVTLEDWGTTYPAYGILDGLVSLADGSASLTPDLKSLTVVAPSVAPADDGEAVLPWEEAAPVIARALALRDEVDPVLPGGDMDVIHVGDHSLFVPPTLITSARLASAGLLDKFAKRRSVRRKLYAAAALRAVTLEEAQQFDEMLNDDLAALQSGAVTMLGATNYVASSGLDVYTLLRIIAGKQAAAAHGASTAAVAAKVTQRVSASALGKSVKALGVLAFAVDLAEGISESRARQRLLAAAAADALLIASLEDARRLLEAEDADPAMIEGLSDAIGQLTAVSQTRLEEYAETAGDAIAGSLPSLAAAVVAFVGTGGAALVVREAAELGEELIGYTREVLTVSAMATLGRVLRPRIEALVVGDEIGGSTADAYAMRELVALHERLGAEATATVYNMLWSERWRNSSSLAGIAKGAGLTLAEWLTADAGTQEVYRDEAAWRVRRVREGAAFAAALPQLLAELQDRYVGPPEAAVETANDSEGTAADQIAPERRILFSEDFESYAVGSRPAHYIIVHDGLGTFEQRVEAEGGNRHLRTAAQASWSLHMREDFAFDLPDVVSVSWRMRVDKDLDWYSYTRPNGARYAHLGSFSVKNADEFAASISINKRETDRKIAAWCPEGDGKEFELQLGVWTKFRAVVDFASGRQLRYANGELFCDTATSFVDLSGRWNSWGEAPGIRFGSGNSGTSVTRFDDIVIRAIGEDEKGETMGALEPAAAPPVDCAGWDSDDGELMERFYRDITPEIALTCLKAGADLNAMLPEQFTPLHAVASLSDDPAVVAALVDAGADPNAANGIGTTPLHTAAAFNTNPAVIAALVEAGADPNELDAFLRAALHFAAGHNENPDVVAALLAAGANPSPELTIPAATALHSAARSGDNPAVIAALLDGGADLDARDEDGKTPLDVAREKNRPAEIIAALKAGAAAPVVDCAGWMSSDDMAVYRFFKDITPKIVLACIEDGVDPNQRGSRDRTPLHAAAAFNSHAGVISALTDAGADPNARAVHDLTPLHMAAIRNKNPGVIVTLTDAGADPNARADDGAAGEDLDYVAPLHLATRWNQRPAIIAVLLEAGADPDARDEHGLAPLHIAKRNGAPAETIALLEEATSDFDEAALPVDCSGWVSGDLERRGKLFRDITPEGVVTCLEEGRDISACDRSGITPLHAAATWNNNPDVIAALIDAGAVISAQDKFGDTPLRYAANSSDSPAVIAALIDAGADIDARDEDGNTLLHDAASSNDNPAVIAALIDAGADIDARDKRGNSPLHDAAASNDNPAVIAALIDAGADIGARDKKGNTPLHDAATWNDNPSVIAELLAAGAEINTRDESGHTPLHDAVFWNKSPGVIAPLLDAGADISARDGHGNTPLHSAAYSSDDPAVIAALLDTGADIGSQNEDGDTPLHEAAAANDNPAIVATLLDAGADNGAGDKKGNTPLHDAATANKNPAVALALLDAGADIQARDNLGNTPLHDAAATMRRNSGVIAALLDAGADPNARDKGGRTPLDLAKEWDRPAGIIAALEVGATRSVDCAGWDSDYKELWESFYTDITPEDVAACLKAGADPNAQGWLGRTPLHVTAKFNDDPAVTKALVDAGARVSARDGSDSAPLHLAVRYGRNPAVIAALLEAGADADARDVGEQTPLHWAASDSDDPAIIAALLEAGADIGARDKYGNTPLHAAAALNQNPAIIAALLDAGADTGARNIWRKTPLHFAASANENPAIITALLDAGADPTERDEDGRTPLDVARQEGRPAEFIAALAGEASVVEEADVAAAPKVPAASSGDCAEWNSRDWETLSKFYGDITLEQVAACLDAGADPNARDREGRTPLHYVVRYNQNPAIIAALLEAGADINARTESERTPLHLAARWSDNPAIIAALLKSGADPNAQEDGGRTPLGVATLTQRPAAIIAMLEEATRDVEEAGSDAGPLDAKTPPTVPGLRELVHNPHLIEELLVGGTDPSTVVEGGLSLLHMAAGFLTDPKVVKGLIEAGADPNARTEGESGMTLLQAAARYNPNSGVIEMLLDAGADPHARDKLFGLTALHTAARFNENAAITQRLLDAGADPDAHGKDGITPLHRAAAHNSTSRVVKLLLGAGADPMARDAEGRTPLDIARTEGNSAKIIAELEEAITVARANASNAGSSVPQASFSSQRIITTEAGAASDVHAADLDGDGDPDVLSASFGDDTISWYENQGSGVFSRQRVITRDANGARSVFAADLDGDGDADVLSASWHDNKIAWYENQGGGSFSSQRVITSRAHGALSVHAADLDGDGDTDVVSASHRSARQMIAWYENHGDGTFTGRVITRDATGARSVFVTDLDNDGYADVLSASAWDDKIAWYRNVGGGEFSSGQIITTEGVGASSVIAADLDGDGDADVLSGWVGDKKVAWYRNSGTGTFSGQRIIFSSQHYIKTDNVVRTPLFASDLDGDGDEDVLSAPLWDDEIVWYENLGGGAFAGQRLITKDVEAVHSVFAADLDGDGNLDVLSASFNDNKIAWYENLSPDREDRPVEAALSEPSQEPDTLAGRVVGGIADWLEQRFGSGGVRFALAAPIRAEEDGDDAVTVHLPGARLVERDSGDAYAFGDLALEVTAEDDAEYGFNAALPLVVEKFTGSGRADGRITVDDSEISGVWRSDLDGATALDATVSNVRTFTDTGQQQLELDSLEISSEVDQGSDALWDGEATINLSDLSYTPGPSNEGVRLGRLDVTATVEDADVGPFMAMSRTGVATAVGSELETLQETLALFSQGGFGRAEVAIALRDLVAIDGGEVVLDLGNLDWLVVFDDREEFTDLAMTIEAAELEINEDATEGFPVELIPNAATVDIALMRYPLRQIAGELQELTRTSGTQAIERALEQVAVTAMAEAGTAFEIRDIRIVGPGIGIEAEGLFQVDTQSALGASGHTNIRIRGFGRVMEWAAEQREADMVNFLVFLKGLGEPLYNESDDLPTYAYSLKVLRDGSITVNDVPLERLLESLQ